MRQKLELVYFNVALVCVLLVGLELGGQVVYYLLKGYPVFNTPLRTEGAVLEPHPYLVGRLRGGIRVEHDGKVVTTTPIHTRWTGAPADSNAIRVAVVGGSTTFGAGVTDTATWPARLQALLGPGYAVTNFGLLGYSTAESIIQMALIVPESRPDIVVLYEGWNDIRSYHDPEQSPDYYSHGMRQFGTLAIPRPQRRPLLDRLADVSATFRLALMAGKTLPRAADSIPIGPVFATPDSFVDRIYHRNLETLKLLSTRTGAYTLFVPQVLNDSWFARHEGGDWWTPHVDNHAMPELIGRFNRLIHDVCGSREAACEVVDDVTRWKWKADDFIDEGHFSGKGGDAFAKLLATRIRGYTEVRQPR